MKFDPVDDDWQRHAAGSEYCVVELPEGGGVLLHVVQEGGRFPVSFCREVPRHAVVPPAAAPRLTRRRSCA
jgi:hypothetical protein